MICYPCRKSETFPLLSPLITRFSPLPFCPRINPHCLCLYLSVSISVYMSLTLSLSLVSLSVSLSPSPSLSLSLCLALSPSYVCLSLCLFFCVCLYASDFLVHLHHSPAKKGRREQKQLRMGKNKQRRTNVKLRRVPRVSPLAQN